MNRPPVRVALALAKGVARGDTDADDLLVAGFNSVEEAAQAHAYLCGFLLQLLAGARAEEITATVEYVQAKLTA